MKEHDLDNTILTMRLPRSEAARYWELMDTAKARDPYASKSVIMRELFMLQQPVTLTAGEVAYFRTGQEPRKASRKPTLIPATGRVRMLVKQEVLGGGLSKKKGLAPVVKRKANGNGK